MVWLSMLHLRIYCGQEGSMAAEEEKFSMSHTVFDSIVIFFNVAYPLFVRGLLAYIRS